MVADGTAAGGGLCVYLSIIYEYLNKYRSIDKIGNIHTLQQLAEVGRRSTVAGAVVVLLEEEEHTAAVAAVTVPQRRAHDSEMAFAEAALLQQPMKME